MKIICLDHEVVAIWQGARLKRYPAGRVASNIRAGGRVVPRTARRPGQPGRGNRGLDPARHHPAGRGFRRANLPRFPYHVLYEIHAESLRIMHVRHNKRHPDYGMERK